MYCPECGTRLDDDAVFCSNCGTKVAEYDMEEEQEETVMVHDSKYRDQQPSVPKKTDTGTKINRRYEEPQPYYEDVRENKKSPIKKGIVPLAAAVFVLGGAFFAQQQGILNLPFLSSPAETEPTVSASKDSVSSEGEQKAAEALAAESKAKVLDPMEDDIEEVVDTQDTYDFYDGVAQVLSTKKNANALDFEWALDYIFYDGNYQGSVITDPSKARKISGDMQPLLNGGWKAYMFSADNDYYDRDWERYLNMWIETIDSSFKIQVNWKYVYNAAAEQTIDEEGSDIFKGTFDADQGTAQASGDVGNIEFHEFYVNADNTAEYALGTYYWASGEKYHIALMRVKES